MEKLNDKKQMKKQTYFDKWLREEIGDKQHFEELSEEEIYKIILKISEITYKRHPVLDLDHSYEEAASIIYKNYLSRDVEKEFNDIKTEDYRYQDEKTGKFYKWIPREECKGFNRMKEQKLTLKHFTNLIFLELNNHYNWYARNKKFYTRINNTISLDFENENMKMIEHIPDTKQTFESIEEDIDITFLSDYIDNEEIPSDYYIKIENKKYNLSYSNLLKLYYYLFDGKRVNSKEITQHIIYKDNQELSKENISYIGKFITSFKKYLLEIGVVNKTNYIEDGKEKIRYGFAQSLS